MTGRRWRFLKVSHVVDGKVHAPGAIGRVTSRRERAGHLAFCLPPSAPATAPAMTAPRPASGRAPIRGRPPSAGGPLFPLLLVSRRYCARSCAR